MCNCNHYRYQLHSLYIELSTQRFIIADKRGFPHRITKCQYSFYEVFIFNPNWKIEVLGDVWHWVWFFSLGNFFLCEQRDILQFSELKGTIKCSVHNGNQILMIAVSKHSFCLFCWTETIDVEILLEKQSTKHLICIWFWK